MTQTAHIYSVPLDADGTPLDKSLVEIKAPPRAPAAPAAAPANDHPDRFDAKAFAASLPPPEVPNRTSMQEVMERAANTDTAMRTPEKPKPRYIGERARGEVYELQDPLEWDGKEYRSTQIRSPKGSQFGEFIAMQNEHGAEQILVWLVCDLPIEVVNELSFDDHLEIRRRADDFLPRQILAQIREAASTSDGETSE